MFAVQLLILMVAYAHASDSTHTQPVEWSNPVAGTSFISGDVIKGGWTASPAVVSPSFRLCAYAGNTKDRKRESGSESAGNSDVLRSCGAAIWPAVKGDDDRVYTVSMIAPTVATELEYFIRMEDNFSNVYISPVFALSPKLHTASSNKSSESEAATDGAANITALAPLAVPSSAPAPPVVPPPVDNPQYPITAPNLGSNPPPSSDVSPPPPSSKPAATAPAPITPARPAVAPYGPTALGTPSFLAAHSTPPVAAIAVPASIAGAIILLAAVLSLDRYMKQRRLRMSEKEALSTKSLAAEKLKADDEERKYYHDRFSPPPLYMPSVEYTQVPRRMTRQAFAARIQGGNPNYGYAYPANHYVRPRHSPSNASSLYSAASVCTPSPHSPHLSLPPMRTMPPPPSLPLPYTYTYERQEEPVPVTQSILADYLLPPSAQPQQPEGLIPMPQLAYVRRVDELPPLSDNPYIRSSRL
ncbi:hypothetical protein BDN71DRAFT_1512377 [Pleurotus eryngii]|uniref:Uncharacterized protein n=1 Tax=Pleurotus eryngii TaxID=5323 RepID=A0A9P6D9Z9_PLEER|nr:hypothetical protein BDN71DRAFT_1512377 [Pleurotus eryngii]